MYVLVSGFVMPQLHFFQPENPQKTKCLYPIQNTNQQKLEIVDAAEALLQMNTTEEVEMPVLSTSDTPTQS